MRATKLIEEVVGVLGRGKPKTVGPATPNADYETEILIPSEEGAQRAGLSPERHQSVRAIRHGLLAALRQVPAFAAAMKEIATDRDLYRVLVSEKHIGLLREGPDGLVKPFLRDAGGHFVENVDLVRVPPSVAGASANIAVQAAFAEVSAKLDVVVTAVENLSELTRFANRGALQGAIDTLEVARQISNEETRRRQMLDACGSLLAQLGLIAGQMDTHVAQMPSEHTGFWFGWNGDRIAQAEKAYSRVRKDFAVLLDGLRGPWRPMSSLVSLPLQRKRSP